MRVDGAWSVIERFASGISGVFSTSLLGAPPHDERYESVIPDHIVREAWAHGFKVIGALWREGVYLLERSAAAELGKSITEIKE